jgi:hypothetical protein
MLQLRLSNNSSSNLVNTSFNPAKLGEIFVVYLLEDLIYTKQTMRRMKPLLTIILIHIFAVFASAAPLSRTDEVSRSITARDEIWIALFDDKPECLTTDEILERLNLSKESTSYLYNSVVRGFSATLSYEQLEVVRSLPCVLTVARNRIVSLAQNPLPTNPTSSISVT